MTLEEFDKMNICGCGYVLVDAGKIGYMNHPMILLDADRNVAKKQYGNWNVKGFDVWKKGKIVIYLVKD